MASRGTPSSLIKIVVVGDTAVGKTSMIERYVDNIFSGDLKSTVGTDFSSKRTVVDGTETTLQIWDTAGQERYKSLSTSYFRGCEAAVVVFDVTDDSSFQKVAYWTDEVLRSLNLSSTEGFPLFVIGNKVDVDPSKRAVTKQRAFEVCKGRGLAYAECSAKTGQDVESVFMACAAAAMDRRDQGLHDIMPKTGGSVSMNRKSYRDSYQEPKGDCKC